MKENRSTNFELLRLLCIIFIITHHTIVHGSFSLNCDKIEINQIFMLFSTTGGSIAVDIFVLLAGYFGIKNEFTQLQPLADQVFSSFAARCNSYGQNLAQVQQG